MTTLGILHPGSMGAAVAAQAMSAGTEVFWCPKGRSTASRERALRYGLSAVDDIGELTERADIILSVCPPAHAKEVAATVAARHFSGIYVDGNAVSPAKMTGISAALLSAGASFVVDGSIVGSPPREGKTTRLYLSGPTEALPPVASLFTESAVHVHQLDGGVGQASALKLSYSSYQKASRVLAAIAYSLARDYGVEAELLDISEGRSKSYLTELDYIPKVAARAWRWAPEMSEVSDALDTAGLPANMAAAAEAVMERWAGQKDNHPTLGEVLKQLHLHAGDQDCE